MAVITISRESGARGNYIGQQLAERLGYRLVDKEIIHEVSMEYGVRQDEFERIYEHGPGLLERYDRRNREIVALIGRIIRGLAQHDRLVILGRGAFTALREFGDVLNVRVVASRGIRIRRIQQDHDLDAQKARALINRLDSERSKYVGAFYGLNWADAGLYDLSVNTATLDPDQALELILQTLSILTKNRDPKRPRVIEEEVDPILDRAIVEALSLLEATGQLS